MNEMICPNCGKFLGVLEGEAQIKCPRCWQFAIYKFKPESEPESESESEPEPDLSE